MPPDGHVDTDSVLRDMHKAAGDYYRHFSISRTTVSSLFVPIGILTSITLVTTCKTSGMPVRSALLIVAFILAAALFMNAIFARWSAICRSLERYYESLEGQPDLRFDAGRQGFRTLFRALTKGTLTKDEKAEFTRLRIKFEFGLDSYFDIFVGAILVLGAIYVWLYHLVFTSVCTP